MALLEYKLQAVGEADIARSLASVERRFAQHQRNINRTIAAGGGGIRQRPGATGRSLSADARQALMAERSAMRLRLMDQKASIRLDMDAHKRRLRAIEAEKRAELRKQSAVIRRELQERKAARQQFARSLGTGVTGAIGTLGAIGRTGAAMLGVGGSVLAGTAVHQAMRLDEMTRRLSILGRGKGEAGIDPKVLERQFVRTAIATGFSPESIAAGAATFAAKTGDLDTALKNQQVFATVAQGAGAMVEEVFAAAADLSKKMDISSVEQMSEAFAILSAQGKKGSFELKAMAGEFPEVLASAASAGVRGVSGVRDVGAIMQIARQASGSDAEASTAVQAMFRQLAAKSADIQSGKAFGGRRVQVFQGGDPTKPMRNFVDVVTDIIAASRGDITQLQEVFDIRGIRAVNPMIAEFRKASEKAGGGKAGVEAGSAAIAALFGEFRNVSADYSEVQRDAADAMKSASVQLEIALVELKQAFSDELMPIVMQVIPELRQLAPAARKVTVGVVSLGKSLAENPLSGLAAIIGTAIAVEVGKAKIASALQTGLIGPLGIAGVAIGAAAGAFFAAKAAIDNMVAQAEAKARGAVASGDEVRARAEAELEATGKLSPETRAQLEQLAETEAGVFRKAERFSREGGIQTIGRAFRSVGATLGLNDETGTLGEEMTVMKTAGSMDYVDAAIRTKGLLALDDSAKRFANGADMVRAQLTAAASEAGEILKKKAGQASLNRSNSPAKP